MKTVVQRFRSRNKTPGPDGITIWIWGVVHNVQSQMLNADFNACLRVGIFPERWKRAKLSLLNKPGKPEGLPSLYRLLCLLDDVSNMLEVLLVIRIKGFMAASRIELTGNQFGFRKGRSTDNAVRALHR